ncbi:MAG: polysulfide reductase NrfD [Spirochaetota bacterium]|nr:polysulfide reductase NrfD [Spirochaetota bacterium]
MRVNYTAIEGKSKGFFILLFVLVVLAIIGLIYTYLMYDEGLGHYTGMSSRVPWAFSIVMAVYYIGLSAGSLVLSALSAVFGKKEYKPFSRMAAYLAVLLIIGALLSIMLDWGRPDRFINPFIYFNPASMFSINAFFYSSYILIGVIYLIAMFTNNEKLVKIMAYIAVIWAIGVHSGTGAIFGFVPRELFQSALLPPSFIAAAVSSGTAMMILVLLITFKATKRELDNRLIKGLSRLLMVFIFVVLYFIIVENTYRAYVPESRHAAIYFLFGGFHSIVFWLGLIFIGSIIPAIILLIPKFRDSITAISIASIFVVLGVLCERYIIVIPGQTAKADLFPNMEVTSNTVVDHVASYSISFPEVLQALGIAAILAFAFVLGLRILNMLPSKAKLHDDPTEEKL